MNAMQPKAKKETETMTKTNPFPTQKGFVLRVANAKRSLERLGRDGLAHIYTRGFDNCFENYDGKAVIWQLMHDALNGNADLERGIRNMGGTCWEHWLALYNAAQPKLHPDLFLSPID